MPQIKTRTDDETKKAFHALAKRRELTESKLLAELIAMAIDVKQELIAVQDSELVAPKPDRIEPARINVRLPAFLLDEAKRRAELAFMSTNRWVVALLQTHLTELPVMTDYEIAVLNSSARELAAIGRNLNQVAKALNESFHETDRVKLADLAELSKDIKLNRQAIRNLVRASLHAWGVSA
jgi:hypothetical protein